MVPRNVQGHIQGHEPPVSIPRAPSVPTGQRATVALALTSDPRDWSTGSLTTLVCPLFRRYLINFLLDATVGMLLIYAGVRAVSVLVEWQQWESLRFGEYGNIP